MSIDRHAAMWRALCSSEGALRFLLAFDSELDITGDGATELLSRARHALLEIAEAKRRSVERASTYQSVVEQAVDLARPGRAAD